MQTMLSIFLLVSSFCFLLPSNGVSLANPLRHASTLRLPSTSVGPIDIAFDSACVGPYTGFRR
uniref:Uncharacterized protein n=1 Tax=Populus trichocarpa TaxID=3694 RepID=A0A2K1Z494_POPTR